MQLPDSYCSDPASTHRDPVAELGLAGLAAVADARALAIRVIDPDGKGREDHWQKGAQSLLTGMILYVLHKAREGGPPATLTQIGAELTNSHRDTHALWADMLAMKDVNPVIVEAGNDMRDRPNEERGAIVAIVHSLVVRCRNARGSDS